MTDISPQLPWGKSLETKCEHGFSLPPVRYGETLLPPENCQSCRTGLAPGFPGLHALQPHGYPAFYPPAQLYSSWSTSLGRPSLPDRNVWPNAPGPLEPRLSMPPPHTMLSPQTESRTAEDIIPSSQASSKKDSPFGVIFLEGNKRKHVAGRRGPLTDDARKKAKLLKSKGGACWRCKVLKKQCDGGTPCEECSTGETRRWHLDCQRGRIEDMIKGKIPNLALGIGEWFLRGDDGRRYRVTFTHDTLSVPSIFRDFMTVAGGVTSLSQPAIPLLDFLKQFHDVETRWPTPYELPTLDLIVKSARFQAALISSDSQPLETMSKGSLLIALTLRCLVLTRELNLVNSSMSRSSFTPDGLCYWPIKKYHDLDPVVEVSESPEASDLSSDIPDQSYGQNISSMLEDLLHITQTVVMRRKPQDWPVLLFTMSLLWLIVQNFDIWWRNGPFKESLKPSCDALERAFYRLCDLFEITSKGFLPLQKHWTKEAYSRLMHHDARLVEAFQWVHDMWLDELSFCEDSDDKDELDNCLLARKIRRLTFGG